jgi:hypothetical protein
MNGKNGQAIGSVFLPSNEPYLGRDSVFQYDEVIVSCLEINSKIAKYTHERDLTELQKAACQLIPQGINISLTIRELIRQGYLFGALVLIRPLIERVAIISYLCKYPSEVRTWQSGWRFKERPKFSEMLETMSGGKIDLDSAKKICELFGHIVHGDPIGSEWNLVQLQEGGLGYSVGKVTNDSDLCDFICVQSYCYLIALMGIMTDLFPDST